MASESTGMASLADPAGAMTFRRPRASSDEIDMTPMIDCVFLLLIFFLVGSTPDVTTSVELPPARHGKGADPLTSVVVTIAAGSGTAPAEFYLADGKVGSPLGGGADAQEAAIKAAVEAGHAQGKPNVLIKAERSVRHRDVARAAAAAAQVPDTKLYLAVFEIQ